MCEVRVLCYILYRTLFQIAMPTPVPLLLKKPMLRRRLLAAAPVLALLAAPAAFAKPGSAKAGSARRYPLRPGEYYWMPHVAPDGAAVAVVNLHTQMAQVFRNGVVIGFSSVSSGKPGHSTPAGIYPVLEKKRFHRSNLYNDAPMPYMLRLTWDGVAMHVGHLPGYPASHGCIRLPAAFAPKLFGVINRGDRVWVAKNALTSIEASPMTTLAPITPDGKALLTLQAYTQPEYWDTAWTETANAASVVAASASMPASTATIASASVAAASTAPAPAPASAPASASAMPLPSAPAPVSVPVSMGVLVSLSQKRLYVLHQGRLVASLALPDSVAQIALEGGAVWTWQPATPDAPAQWVAETKTLPELAGLPNLLLPPGSSFTQRLYPRMAAGSLLFVSQLAAVNDLHFAVPAT